MQCLYFSGKATSIDLYSLPSGDTYIQCTQLMYADSYKNSLSEVSEGMKVAVER